MKNKDLDFDHIRSALNHTENKVEKENRDFQSTRHDTDLIHTELNNLTNQEAVLKLELHQIEV
jgi:hypothetical protein